MNGWWQEHILLRNYNTVHLTEIPRFAAHTRPRREKKLQAFCERLNIPVVLPCYGTVHHYTGKTVSFEKPLFPGYVFLQLKSDLRSPVLKSGNIATLIEIPDQELFKKRLDDILAALATELEIFVAVDIGKGCHVKIKNGPLSGMTGWVEERYGRSTVLLRVDAIGQSAAVKIETDWLESILSE